MGGPTAGVPKRRKRNGFWSTLFVDLLRVAIALAILHAFVFNFSLVRGSSMQPCIFDGDRLLVDKISYSLAEVKRFDVVILTCPKEPTVDYVKRIIGLPNDQVELKDGRLFVNGETLTEPFAPVCDYAGDGTWRVPAGHFFVLGDNRPVSSDSREGWCVARTAIRGKVRACFWPLGRAQVF